MPRESRTTGEAPTRSMGAETARSPPTITASARQAAARSGPRRRSVATRRMAVMPSAHSAGIQVLRAVMTTTSGMTAATGDNGSRASRAPRPGPGSPGAGIPAALVDSALSGLGVGPVELLTGVGRLAGVVSLMPIPSRRRGMVLPPRGPLRRESGGPARAGAGPIEPATRCWRGSRALVLFPRLRPRPG